MFNRAAPRRPCRRATARGSGLPRAPTPRPAVCVGWRTPGGAGGAAVPSLAGARAHARTRWWVELLALGWLLWLYDAITNLAPLRVHAALAHATSVLGLEQALHVDPERAMDQWLAARPTLGL